MLLLGAEEKVRTGSTLDADTVPLVRERQTVRATIILETIVPKVSIIVFATLDD
jgi:hypothetical protein